MARRDFKNRFLHGKRQKKITNGSCKTRQPQKEGIEHLNT